MRKLFNFIRLFTALFTPLVFIFPAQVHAKKNLKAKILQKRIKKETNKVDYAIKVARQEHGAIKQLTLNSLLKNKKLKLMIKSSQYMKSMCLFIDRECMRFYNISLVYLRSELKKNNAELLNLDQQLKYSFNRLEILNKKINTLENNLVFKTERNLVKTVIPELKNAFVCVKVEGWNPARGIFVKPESVKNMPFPFFVKDVVKIRKKTYMIILEADKYDLNFCYVKKPLTKKGELIKMGKGIVRGVAGNPIKLNTVLISILKNGKFLDPSFMCRP